MFFMLLAHIYHFTEPTQSPEQLRGGLWCSFGQAPGHSKGFDMLSAGFSMPMIWSDLRLAKDAVGCWLRLVACCEQAVWNYMEHLHMYMENKIKDGLLKMNFLMS